MSAVAIAITIMLVLLLLKQPVFAAVLTGSAIYFALTPGVQTVIFAQRILVACENTALLAIPFFVGAGVLMNYGGVTKRIMDFCAVVTGRMTGGLAQVNVLLSTLIGGLSGSNLADAAMEAKMLVPEMERNGFSKAFSSVVTACSAIITPLIPPGMILIVYGIAANVSIGKLFIAGFGPGIMLCATLMIAVHIISKKRGYKPIRTEKLPAGEAFRITWKAVPPLCLPVIIIGGIRFGIFTPTEAGAVSLVYAIILGILYKEFNKDSIKQVLKETVVTTSSIMAIIGAANALSWVLTREQIPQALSNALSSAISSKYIFLLLVNLLLIVVGMFMEGTAATIILAPLLAPVAESFGIDAIHFAMVFIFNISLGTITPPMGTVMFVTCGITGCKIKDFLKDVVPFYLVFIICLFLLTLIPAFSTGLVTLFYG